MKQFFKDNWFKICILVIVLVGIVGYLSFLNTVEQNKQYQQLENRIKVNSDKDALDSCLESAERVYSLDWDISCKTNGVNSKEPDCSLPNTTADHIEDRLQINKQNCFKQYPQ